jgi:hypothetical protein
MGLEQGSIAFVNKATNFLTNSMQLDSSEAASCAATQRLHSILWSPKIHYLSHRALHKSLSSARQVQSIPSNPVSLILSTHIRLGLPSGLSNFWLSHQ